MVPGPLRKEAYEDDRPPSARAKCSGLPTAVASRLMLKQSHSIVLCPSLAKTIRCFQVDATKDPPSMRCYLCTAHAFPHAAVCGSKTWDDHESEISRGTPQRPKRLKRLCIALACSCVESSSQQKWVAGRGQHCARKMGQDKTARRCGVC